MDVGVLSNYGDFIELIRTRDAKIDNASALVKFLVKNSEYVKESLEHPRDYELVAERVHDLTADDLSYSKLREKLQKLFQRVPQFQVKTADRQIQIGEDTYPVHSKLLAAQDYMLLFQMEAVIAKDALVLSENFSKEARLAYVNYLERGIPIPAQQALEVLPIASQDENEFLANFLWKKLHGNGNLLSDVLVIWIQTHMKQEDPLGTFIEKIEQLKRQLPEGREYKTLDRHELFCALLNENKGHPAFRLKNVEFSENEKQVARKILSFTNPAYLQGKNHKKIMRSLQKRLHSDEPLIDPVKVRVEEKELSYFPIMIAGHCQQFHSDGTHWLSKDTEQFPLDLQFEVLKALSEEKELPLGLESWKLLGLAELQGIETLRKTAQQRILGAISLEQIFNECLASQVDEPLIDFLNKAFLLGKMQEGCSLFKIYCSNLDFERLSQLLSTCFLQLSTKILENSSFRLAIKALIKQLRKIEQTDQLLASLFIHLEKHFVPELFLSLIECCKESAFRMITTNEVSDEKQLQEMVSRAENELFSKLLAYAEKAAEIPSTLKLYFDANSVGINIEGHLLHYGITFALDKGEGMNIKILEDIQKRFDCRSISFWGVNWNRWQTLNIGSFFNSERSIQGLNIDTEGRVEPEIFLEISRRLQKMPNLNFLSIHGPKDQRGFYCESVDLPSIEKMVQAMLDHPNLRSLSLDVRAEECKEELREYMKQIEGVDFYFGGYGGASMEFQRK